MSGTRKRKREPVGENKNHTGDSNDLSLQAFEAVIKPASQHHRVTLAGASSEDINSTGLIEWNTLNFDEPILVDRYDARLLLVSLPNAPAYKASEKLVFEDGWDDLPSDSEDLFFFSANEADDIRREKRRRLADSNHKARLLAIEAADSEESPINNWGSDEEPDDSIMVLMSKTAAYISTSPNPVQLEMRILANNGTDPRFSFLRGRWKQAWSRAKEASRTAGKHVPTTNTLVTYESEDDVEEEDNSITSPIVPSEHAENDAKIKAERRARVKEWSRKRKEANSGSHM